MMQTAQKMGGIAALIGAATNLLGGVVYATLADSSGHSDTELSSKPANTSTGVCHPSVLRGRPLSSSATLSRSAWKCNDRSVPFGKYCRSNPLVFSLVPRCHGECGSQKYTSIPVATEKSACRAISFP